MPAQIEYFDYSVLVAPPNGHLEPLPIPLGPNWEPNDVRIVMVSAAGVSGDAMLEMPMTPDPPSGFTQAYALNPDQETHGVYFRRLAVGDTDNISVSWAKPSGWEHFMFVVLTARGVDLSTNPTAGWLKLSAIQAATTATAASVSVPRAGEMLFMAGSVQSPWPNSSPAWPVSIGIPTGWQHVVATDKSGNTFYQYGTDPSLVVVGKKFTASGSTGTVTFPTSQGTPAFNGLYVFLTPAADVSVTLGAA